VAWISDQTVSAIKATQKMLDMIDYNTSIINFGTLWQLRAYFNCSWAMVSDQEVTAVGKKVLRCNRSAGFRIMTFNYDEALIGHVAIEATGDSITR
jgi:hypothetical protein